MFGLKIITKEEYRRLIECKKDYQDLKFDYEILKKSINDSKKEIESLRKELEKLRCSGRPMPENEEPKTPLVEGHHVICNESRRCDGCKDETPTCKKLYTGKGTICVEPDTPGEVIKFD